MSASRTARLFLDAMTFKAHRRIQDRIYARWREEFMACPKAINTALTFTADPPVDAYNCRCSTDPLVFDRKLTLVKEPTA